MNLQLNWKHALVCGASKGLGKAAAIELAKMGAQITLVARSEHLLKENVEELNSINGLNNNFLCIDFCNQKLLHEKVSLLNKRMPIQILINNTGGPSGGKMMEASNDSLVDAFNNHILTSQSLSRIVIPSMQTFGYGRIINIVSTSVRQPINGIGVSNTIRGAMASWAKTLSNELANSGITVNNVLPGTTETSRLDEIVEVKMKNNSWTREQALSKMIAEIPMSRFAKPNEIGAAIAFLASPAAAYITGVSLPVDGGKIRSI